MSDSTERSQFGESLGRFGGRLLQGFSHRLELFGLELGEERQRLLGVLLVALAVAVLLLLGLINLSLLLVLVYWDRRVQVAVALTLVYLGSGAVLALWLRARLRRAGLPFAATLQELRRDAELLRGRGDES